MIEVITSNEFRGNIKSFFDKIDKGVEIIVKRKNNRAYKIVPIGEEDTLMSKEALSARIEEAIEERKNGEVVEIQSKEQFAKFFGHGPL